MQTKQTQQKPDLSQQRTRKGQPSKTQNFGTVATLLHLNSMERNSGPMSAHTSKGLVEIPVFYPHQAIMRGTKAPCNTHACIHPRHTHTHTHTHTLSTPTGWCQGRLGREPGCSSILSIPLLSFSGDQVGTLDFPHPIIIRQTIIILARLVSEEA